MALFRRKRAATDTSEGTDTLVEGPADSSAARPDEAAAGDPGAPASGSRAPYDPEVGPFDVGSLASREGLVDLGAILLPGIQGLVMSMEMDQSTGDVTAVRIHLGDSQLQLQAFAAPKSTGIWDEIRAEIAASLADSGGSGGSASEQEGPFGTELVVRVPGRGADGRGVTTAMRFLGIDRPRWFLRGVLSGPAAADDEAAQPFIDLLHVTVVDRGGEPMAPRELLPLRLPPEAPAEPAPGAPGDPAGEPVSTDDLRPFDRGPEITEIR